MVDICGYIVRWGLKPFYSILQLGNWFELAFGWLCMLFVYSAGLFFFFFHIPCNGRDPMHRRLHLHFCNPAPLRTEDGSTDHLPRGTACSWGLTTAVFPSFFSFNQAIDPQLPEVAG